MEPLGKISSTPVTEADQLISTRPVTHSPIAESEPGSRKVAGKEAGTVPWPFKEVPSEKIDHIASALLNYVRSVQRDLSIEVHRGTGRVMVQVISKLDGKVIREIPPEELLDLAAKMEEVVGVIFNKNA